MTGQCPAPAGTDAPVSPERLAQLDRKIGLSEPESLYEQEWVEIADELLGEVKRLTAANENIRLVRGQLRHAWGAEHTARLNAEQERDALRIICTDAAELFERISSADGSGHADLARRIRERMAQAAGTATSEARP